MECFKHWRHYLKGSRYTIEVLIDYNNLHYFINTKYLKSRQARWAIYLSSFDFEIHYHKGSANLVDALSRRPNYIPNGPINII
jgi:hypothetical protein